MDTAPGVRFVHSTRASPAKTLLNSPVGVRIIKPVPAALVVKYVFPALGTAPLLQLVDPV